METVSPKVLISYSWDSPKLKAWVAKLATDLRQNGIDVILDQWDLKKGDSMSYFMEQSVTISDRVLCILTPEYKRKCDNRSGGSGYESAIITSEILCNVTTSKFIPVLKSGSFYESSPIFLNGRFGIDMSKQKDYDVKLNELIGEILGISQKPDLKPKP